MTWSHKKFLTIPKVWYSRLLVDPLYCRLWGNCGLTKGAQDIVEFLDQFYFTKKLMSVLREKQLKNFQKYFIPCMSKDMQGTNCTILCPQTSNHSSYEVQYSIHAFWFLCPPYYSHNRESKCKPLSECGTYHNCISFYYKQIDRITISE